MSATPAFATAGPSSGKTVDNELNEGSVEKTEKCKHCDYDVASKVLELHELHCAKHNTLCPDCRERVAKEELEEHRNQEHGQTKCDLCKELITNNLLMEHQAKECPQRLVNCRYCEIPKPSNTLSDHVEACGARTEKCSKCSQYIRFSDQELHDLTNCAQPAPVTVSQRPQRVHEDPMTAALLEMNDRDGPVDFVSAVLKQTRGRGFNEHNQLNRGMVNMMDGEGFYNQERNLMAEFEPLNYFRDQNHSVRSRMGYEDKYERVIRESAYSDNHSDLQRYGMHNRQHSRESNARKQPVLRLGTVGESMKTAGCNKTAYRQDNTISEKKNTGTNKEQRSERHERNTAEQLNKCYSRGDSMRHEVSDEQELVQDFKNNLRCRSGASDDIELDSKTDDNDDMYEKIHVSERYSAENDDVITLPCEICGKHIIMEFLMQHQEECRWSVNAAGPEELESDLDRGVRFGIQGEMLRETEIGPLRQREVLRETEIGPLRQTETENERQRKAWREGQKKILREVEKKTARGVGNDFHGTSHYDEKTGRLVQSSDDRKGFLPHSRRDYNPSGYDRDKMDRVTYPAVSRLDSLDTKRSDQVRDREDEKRKKQQYREAEQQQPDEILIPCELCGIPIVADQLLEHERFCFRQEEAL